MVTQQAPVVFTKQPYIEQEDHRRIAQWEFNALSQSEIAKMAEAQIFEGKYYDSATGKPIQGGLLDPRLGPANRQSGNCATCSAKLSDCPGHFGYFMLSLPVFNVGYLNVVVDVLKCICKMCSRILLDERLRSKKELMKDMKSVVKECVKPLTNHRAVKCSHCGYTNGNVRRVPGDVGIQHDLAERTVDGVVVDEYESAILDKGVINMQQIFLLDPARVYSLFRKMLDVDCRFLCLKTRPENLLLTCILVPPIAIRPSVLVGGSQSNEDDVTVRLKRIIQANAKLRLQLSSAGSSSAVSLSCWEELQIEVAQYINSEARVHLPLSLRTQQPTKPLSGLVQRLKGKTGRFRGTLSGKRVEYTGRSVISPDPNLKITEVGIPMEMAKILSYPERVSKHNIDKLRLCVSNGPYKYPGAKMLRNHDGSEFTLKVNRQGRALGLKCGDIVDRHLEDGDIVLFNRQPSLHRMSVMCHRARIMPHSRTLRFNESVCNPYNADFDGDEMNIHVPQTEEARAEALMLMGVHNNLCTPKNGEILVASTQDFLTSSFLITRKDTFYDRASFSLLCSYMVDGEDSVDLPTPAVVKPVELWTGKQLFNVLVRPNSNVRVYLNLIVKEKSYTSTRTEDGRETDAMCPNDGFVYFRNSELLSGQLGKATLGNGNKDGLYSVLLRDYEAHAAASCMNRLAKLSARWIGNHGFSIGLSDVQPSDNLYDEKEKIIKEGYSKCDSQIELYNQRKLESLESLESGISEVLNKIRDQTGKLCMQKLHWRNSPLIMSQCGSKGSAINISQMVACVGQQSVGGRRAPDGFIDRSLPHFPRNAKMPAAKGFVANSFYSGLTPTEFFFHTMGGREGLVDTAVKTAETGYMSRRLSKVLEDLAVHYDKTVRVANGGIVQFCYGDDGMDPAMMEGKSGAPIDLFRMFLKAKATCPAEENDSSLSPEQVSEVVRSRLSEQDMIPEDGLSMCFKSSIEKFLDEYGKAQRKTQETFLLNQSSGWEVKSAILENIVKNISGVTSRQLEVFLDTCISRYHSKRIDAGTAIGAIGAQSIGEPVTQMTLKTFHFAGVASMNVTLGVPRIKEIIDGAKNIKTPIITTVLECDNNAMIARMVAGRIGSTKLGQVAKRIEILMTPRQACIVIKLDMVMIRDAQLSIDVDVVKESILKVPRIKLKQENIQVPDNKTLEVFSQDKDRRRLYFELYRLKSILPNVTVRGITTVQRVVIDESDVKKDKEDVQVKGADVVGKKYRLFAEGKGLLAVMSTEGVDGCKTTSNDIIEVQQTLGIEAARISIIEEIKYTMKQHGMNIDDRHMMLLADAMTSRGQVLGMTRFGLQKMDKSVLMGASFERTDDHLFNACVKGAVDKIEGVSESIIMGIPMPIGTGMFKVKHTLPTT
ncbi:DNA-directed RNA polymerase III subunit 1-like [Rosa sericea]